MSLWIREHGGSYTFASATCAKKWEEIKKGGVASRSDS